MSIVTPIKRKRDNPGESMRDGGPTSFGSHNRNEPAEGLLTPKPPVNMWTKWYATPEAKVAAVTAELAEITSRLSDPAEWSTMLTMMSRFPHLSRENQAMIGAQNPSATRVAKYAKWDELGRHVRHGVKGLVILESKRYRVDLMDNAGRPLLDGAGEPRTESRIAPTPISATMFDISQTDGSLHAPAVRVLSTTPPENLIEDLINAADERGFAVVYEEFEDDTLTSYTTNDGGPRIVLREGANETEVAHALAHELGHITAGHVSRSDYNDGHGSHDGRAEAEAGSIAHALLLANNMASDADGEQIMGAWTTKRTESVTSASLTIHAAMRSLFSGTSWSNVA
jgi:hypothetical protein